MLILARFHMQGDKNAADQAAVDMMRKVLNTGISVRHAAESASRLSLLCTLLTLRVPAVNMDGVVVIGEGEKDEVTTLS